MTEEEKRKRGLSEPDTPTSELKHRVRTQQKMLEDIHLAVCGDDFDPAKPGLLRQVKLHNEALFGRDGNGGMKADIDGFKSKQNQILGASILIGFLGTALGIGAAIFESVGSWVKKP